MGRGALSLITEDPSDISSWSKTFILPKCVLARPAASHRLRWQEIRDLVKSRLARWSEGEFEHLWQEASSSLKSPSNHRGKSVSKQHNISRSIRAIQDGQYSKALKALASEGLAQPDKDVLNEMTKKHPQSPRPVLPEGPATQPPKLSESAVLRGVRSFPSGSAPGPSGLRPSHLQEAVNCPSPDQANKLLFSLTSFVGRTPPTICPHLCGATLLASIKKSGGLRPIAVGETLRHMTSKCLAASARSDALARLLPHQLGVGSEEDGRPLSIQLATFYPTRPQIKAGSSSPTLSIRSTGSPCLRSSANTCQCYHHGLRAATATNLASC